MKKQFQILNIAIAIVLVSCGKHNAEISARTTNEAKELSTNKSPAINEPDFLLIDHEGRIRFNSESNDQVKSPAYTPSSASISNRIATTEHPKLAVD